MSNWEGVQATPSEHRTVGEHRARCINCTEWCYPEDLCQCCSLKRDGFYLVLAQGREAHVQFWPKSGSVQVTIRKRPPSGT